MKKGIIASLHRRRCLTDPSNGARQVADAELAHLLRLPVQPWTLRTPQNCIPAARSHLALPHPGGET